MKKEKDLGIFRQFYYRNYYTLWQDNGLLLKEKRPSKSQDICEENKKKKKWDQHDIFVLKYIVLWSLFISLDSRMLNNSV